MDNPKYHCEICGGDHPTSEHPEKDGAYTTEIEEELESLFSNDSVKTEEEFDSAVLRTFEVVCGDEGKEEFYTYVLPAIKSIYGNNYRKAGLRILDIIDQGSSQPRKNIRKYFESVVANSEKEFSGLNKTEVFKKIESDISSLISKQNEELKQKGVIAVIVFGSYAKGNFSEKSDLDCICITAIDDDGIYIPEEEQYVRYVDQFDDRVNRMLRMEVDMPYGAIPISSEEELRKEIYDPSGLINGQYKIISPYLDIVARLESIIQDTTEGTKE